MSAGLLGDPMPHSAERATQLRDAFQRKHSRINLRQRRRDRFCTDGPLGIPAVMVDVGGEA